MLHRNITIPHRFVLLTDQMEAKYTSLIQPIPLWDEWRNLDCEEWRREFPQCWVRLKAFSAGVREVLGDRFVSIDLDCVALGNLDRILGRTEDFLICHRAALTEAELANRYQASMWMMDTGAREHVWREFKGEQSFEALRADGVPKYYMSTDQGWMLYSLGPHEAGWTMSDGVYFWPWLKANEYEDRPPDNARIVFFQGLHKPWNMEDAPGWVSEHYR